jgi:hypothetical protein
MAQTGTLSGINAIYHQLADATNMDSNLKGVIYSKIFEKQANQHNALEQFTSEVDSASTAGGVRSIFAKKTDLKAGGGDKVYFNVIGPPGGPGAAGAQTLIDRVSTVAMKTYFATVAFHRDAVSFTKDVYEFLSAGRNLERTTMALLSKKMGILKQNHMLMRLIRSATSSNTYRPNNRATTDTLLATDKIDLDNVISARARLNVLGGNPIKQRVGPNGSPIKGYLFFGSDMAFLPIRNSDAFMTLLSNGTMRGEQNAMFTGELFDWQGMPLYELPTTDEKWDDFLGTPLAPKAKLGTAFTVSSNPLKMVVNSGNTLPQYFGFFPGAPYSFDGETASAVSGTYYAWLINPDGSVGFVRYTNAGFSGGSANAITLTGVLSHTTSGAGYRTLGNLSVGDGATHAGSGVITVLGNGVTVPKSGWVYTTSFAKDAIILPANANGAVIGNSFVLGAMAGCFAHGRIDKAMIVQEEDFGFIRSRGFETIFGTCVTTDPYSVPSGYLKVEHAVEHEGYAVPTMVASHVES